MTIENFDSLLTRLENDASKYLKDKMHPFEKGGFACPWLHW
jgi:hypothetical protein